MMGCNEAVDDDCYDSEYPYHEVTLYEYYIDVTEVTQGDFNVCVGAGVCNTSWNPDCTWDPNGMPEHPVTCVDWHNAKTYCEWLGKRLPTEAEWEKAARGTDGRKYPWGNEDATCDYAVIENDGGVNGCGTGGFLPVCSKSPAGDSPYGLCDMLGNVSEWVADWKDNNYYYVSPANNPLGPFSAMYRGVRGCSYSSLAAWCRVSRRGSLWPGDIKYHMGFRCARSAAECPAGQNCTGLECGSDPVCGESCGNCSGYEVCDQGQCVESGGLVWIPIPGGTFIMGCSPGDEDCDIDEYPPHEVTVSSFEMLETEVTEIQYWSVAGENPSCLFGFDGPHTPVECIDWYEAKAFCEALGGGRLCTEAEWEYAARGGTTTKYYCGDDSSCLDDIAWWWSNSSYGPQFGRQKHEVKGKEPNDYGLYDMLGNVAEWVEDCWHNDYDLNDDGEGDWDVGYPAWMADCSSGSRVVRGSYFLAFASHLRMSHRGGNEPSFASQGAVGFRCCKSE
jgi:formylglycine-generating enzyme required for sulfatase activity